MRPAARWPLHPAPVEGEALSSWLRRIAACYGMDLSDLLEHDLDHRQSDDLDLAPPTALLDRLVGRSGLDRDRLHGMTLAGLTPWLLDTLAPNPDRAAFHTYVGQLAVLLPRHALPSRTVRAWRAWLPKQPVPRDCPRCRQAGDHHARLLVRALPLLLSCPVHGCWLEVDPDPLVPWASADVEPHPASAAITLMDRRTWQALTQGAMVLPRRRVHAGLWFRLLRTLLEELNTAPSRQREQALDIGAIWTRCGHPLRAGLRSWRSYESLEWSIQRCLLEAAAVTMEMIETGELTARGPESALFLPEPARADVAGWLFPQPAAVLTPWQLAWAATKQAVAQAKHSPEVARGLSGLILYGRHDANAIGEARRLLSDVGIPVEFLSP
jgi:hypothetical protein